MNTQKQLCEAMAELCCGNALPAFSDNSELSLFSGGKDPSTVFALAANGQAGVENMLEIFANEMRVAMTLTGVTSVARIDGTILA